FDHWELRGGCHFEADWVSMDDCADVFWLFCLDGRRLWSRASTPATALLALRAWIFLRSVRALHDVSPATFSDAAAHDRGGILLQYRQDYLRFRSRLFWIICDRGRLPENLALCWRSFRARCPFCFASA